MHPNENTNQRPRRIYDGDVIERAGLRFRVNFEQDCDYGAPWDECDGHGPVREGRTSSYGHASKAPGERVLGTTRWATWFYDVAAATELAKRDGWGLSPQDVADLGKRLGHEPTAGEIRAEAVRQDFEYLRGYLRDDWGYVVVRVVMVNDDDEETGEPDYLGGVETFKNYHEVTAWDMAGDLAHQHQRALGVAQSDAAKELAERTYWASRDVATVGLEP